MLKQFIHRGEKGQIAILLALAMVGLLGIVGLALDGGMLYWNQRRAQNGADAAAIAGVGALSAIVTEKGYDCNTSNDAELKIRDAVRKYAGNNEVPNADGGANVRAYYLRQASNGDWVEITHSDSGEPWMVGDTGTIPCVKVRGLRVETNFPQPTFIAGIIGIAETNVTVDASAVFKYNTWCTDFTVIALSQEEKLDILKLCGSSITVEGGMHSNCGMHICGGGQEIVLEAGEPVEYGQGECPTNIASDAKIEGGPLPDEPGKGITSADYFTLSEEDIGYRFDDFDWDGWVQLETPSADYHNFGNKDIGPADIKNPNGTLKDGLFVTKGDIKLTKVVNAADKPWHATLVALGTVQISGGFKQIPYSRGIFIFTLSNNLSNGAVNLSGDGNEWLGQILAPNGLVSMSGAKNSDLGGMIIGYEVDLSGSNISIHRSDGYCPYNPPNVLLTE